MKKTTILKRLAITFCLMSTLVACGQKGNLYLPEGKSLISWMS